MKQLFQFALKVIAEFFLFALFSACCAKIAFAQVIVNEVMPAPTLGNEWVELKNLTDQTVSLTGWTVADDAGTLTPLPLFSQSSIGPLGLFVFEVKNRLNNSGDRVLLRRPDLSQADLFTYTSSSSQQSWSRRSVEDSAFILATPTPGQENAVPSPQPSPSLSPSPQSTVSPQVSPGVSPQPTATPSATPSFSPVPLPSPSPQPSPVLVSTPTPLPISSPIPSPQLFSQPLQLSEIVACAETGQPEWFELYNPNTVTVTLHSWKIKDSTTNIRTFDLTLSPLSYGVVELSSAILNNDGDSFYLLDQSSNQLAHVELTECVQNQSTIYTTQGWVLTETVTKGSSNIYSSTLPSATPQPSSSVVASVDPLLTPSSSVDSSENTTDTPSLPLLQQFLDQNTVAAQITPTPDFLSDSNLASSFSPEPSPSTESNQSATGEILTGKTPTPESSKSITEQVTTNGFTLPQTTKTILFLTSLGMMACGCYGGYEWYTEQRVKTTLEIL